MFKNFPQRIQNFPQRRWPSSLVQPFWGPRHPSDGREAVANSRARQGPLWAQWHWLGTSCGVPEALGHATLDPPPTSREKPPPQTISHCPYLARGGSSRPCYWSGGLPGDQSLPLPCGRPTTNIEPEAGQWSQWYKARPRGRCVAKSEL